MSFTESKIIKQITILPESGAVNVQWANQVLKDGTEVISETFERKAYSAGLTGFSTEVGALDVDAFLAAFDTATLDEKVEALAAKATAESALTAKQTEMDAALATAQAAHAAELAAKDAEIAALEVQVVALTPAPSAPAVVASPRQIRQALTAADMRAAVEDTVAAGDQDIKDWWNFSTAFERTNPQVTAMATALGVSDEELDGLWALAVTL